MPKLIIQIPCYNEEETLPATVADLPREVDGFDTVEWLVIDDGSSDRTAEVARELGVHHIVRHPRNKGLATTFLTGLDAALRAGADVIVNTDADNQYDASYIPAIATPVLTGQADIVVGERPIETVAEFSALKRRLQRVGSWVVRKFSGTPVADAASGFRAFNREAAMRLQVFGRYTYTMETLIQAGFERLAVLSVPIAVNPQTRESRLVKSMGQYVRRSAQTIIRSFVLYRPFRFFTAMAAIPFIVSAILGIRWLAYYFFADEYRSRLPSLVVAGILLVVAFQIWMVGFVADVVAATRRTQAELRLDNRRRELDAARTAGTPAATIDPAGADPPGAS